MRKIIAFYSGYYAGTDYAAAMAVPTNFTENQIGEEVYCWAWEQHNQWVDDIEDDGMEPEPNAYWEDYDPNKHDMLRQGGGSFEGDF